IRTELFSPILISLGTAVVATFFSFVIGIALAHWRSAFKKSWGDVLDGLLLLPVVLPPTVVGLLLLLFFGRMSPVGQFLSSLGLSVVFTPAGTVIAAFVISFPLMYQSALAAFRLISRELIDDARTLGLGEWRILLHVKIPLALPGIAAGTILSFVRALGEFGATLMLAGNIPGKTQTLPVAIFFSVEAGETKFALLLAAILISISGAAVYLLGRLSREK
ncbi:MAG: molybdate ABC transporter permease subunit, partial [Spirochaetia bacterium]|nr:molybdate ABC transporter permease subunit [Spirochaetia bacterium]